MKRSIFLNRTATIKVDFGMGDLVEVVFKPRYLTKGVLEHLESLAEADDTKASETLKQFANELGEAIVFVDLEEEDGSRKINPDVSPEDRAVALAEAFDLSSMAKLLRAIRDKVENPTDDDSPNSSSGSLVKVQ